VPALGLASSAPIELPPSRILRRDSYAKDSHIGHTPTGMSSGQRRGGTTGHLARGIFL